MKEEPQIEPPNMVYRGDGKMTCVMAMGSKNSMMAHALRETGSIIHKLMAHIFGQTVRNIVETLMVHFYKVLEL
jgi:hypothetical protein